MNIADEALVEAQGVREAYPWMAVDDGCESVFANLNPYANAPVTVK